MELCFRSLFRAILLFFLVYCFSFTSTDAYDALDPNGNITIKWDVISWTPDGYVAVVTIFNFQQYRHIQAPGWTLGWTWAKKEVIWTMMGGQTTEQGDCSRFKGNIPHCLTWNVTCTYSQFLAQKLRLAVSHSRPFTMTQLSLVQPVLVDAKITLLSQEAVLNDTAMLWGVKFYNDLLMQAGPLGNVQSELLFRKDKSTFTFEKGWAFPRRIYFNGDNCVMPPPDAYPYLPNAGLRKNISLLMLSIALLLSVAFHFACV
ncbi:hypothetical protein DH2020_009539 [Rehmannia glutinosa]|uniref:COBRA C-terminal domain-containing protein n=1 Tax=Rehmannia glutinosa TaxID=99300 RepID=A0ABR0X7W0_REHGL